MLRNKLMAMIAVSTLALTGCDIFEDDDDTTIVEPAVLRVLHASPDAPAVDVLIDGAVQVAGANFKDGTGNLVVAPGTYNVQVDGLTPGGNTTVIGPVDLELASGIEYTVIASGEVASIAPLIIELPNESPAVGNLRATVVHGAPNAPAVDVYVTAPGADLAASAALGSFSFGESLGPVEVAGGDYQIRVTLAGDAAAVVYDSGTLTLPGGLDLLLTAVQNTTTGESPISLSVLDGTGSSEILDTNTPASLRVIHNSPDAPAVDIIVNDDFDNPLVPGLAFPNFTGFVDVPPATYNVKVTPAGDAGTIVIDADLDLAAGTEYSVYATGLLAEIAPQVLVDERRAVATQAQLRVLHGSPSAGPVDIFATAPGTDITTVSPNFSNVPFRAETGYVQLPAGTYTVTVAPTGTTTAAIGPIDITLEAGGVYTAVARDATGSGTPLGLILLDDFNLLAAEAQP
ncbi:MAG: DUF4397 domain-containing protein [Pseudomonadota bacterium]